MIEQQQRDPEAERRDLAARREQIAEARTELARAEEGLRRFEDRYETLRRSYAEARRGGASERELAGIAERGQAVRARMDKGRGYVPERRAELDRAEERVAALERDLYAREKAAEPARDHEGQERGRQGQGDGLGPLRDSEEVGRFRRLTRGGMGAQEARKQVIGAREEGRETSAKPAAEKDRDGHAREGQDRGVGEGVGVKEAAERLGVSETTVRTRVKRGELEASKDDRGRLKVRLDGREQGRDTGREADEREPGPDAENATKEAISREDDRPAVGKAGRAPSVGAARVGRPRALGAQRERDHAEVERDR